MFSWLSSGVCVGLAALLAGCGSAAEEASTSERRPRATPEKPDKAAFVERVETVCREGLEQWSTPRAVARKLPPSPIQTSAPPKARRLAERLRGYRAIVQVVIDEVQRGPRPKADSATEKYVVALSRAATELEGDELKIRQQWNRILQAPAVLRYLRQARRLAKPAGFAGCASFPGRL